LLMLRLFLRDQGQEHIPKIVPKKEQHQRNPQKAHALCFTFTSGD